MIKVFVNSSGYNIEHNGEMIVTCVNPFIPFKDLLINLGFDINTEKVEIHEGNNIETIERIESDNVDEDSIINAMNETFTAPNLGKYRTTFESQTDTNSSIKDAPKSTKNESAKQGNVPVGSVECPNEGDLIYVDGIIGVLSTITGGVGTVMTVYKSNDPIVVYSENGTYENGIIGVLL